MTAPVILVEAQPRRASDGVAVPVRLAGAGGALPYFYGGQHWRAGLAGLPVSTARLDFDGVQPGGGGVAQAIELAWAPASNAALAELAALVWNDAPFTVRVGPEGAELPPIVTSGLGLDCTVDGGKLRLPLADSAMDLKRPLLVDRYAGTGGIDGPVEWQDQIKPRMWGRCFNVLGRVIDKANNIWVFGDPRRPIMAFDQVRDRGVGDVTVTVLGWQGSAEATFAALQSTAVGSAAAVSCPSINAVKWWTTPSGDLRADLRGETAGGYVETAAEVAARIVASRSTLAFAPGEVAAAVAARPAPFGWRVDADTATAAGELSELLGDVSLSWLLIDNQIVLRRWDWTASQRIARSHAVNRRTVYKPVTARKVGYRRNQAPMQRSDIAAVVLARDIAYGDGTPIETLKPAEAGATYGAPGNAPVGNSTGNAVVTNIATNAQNLQLLAQRVTPIEQLLAPSGSIQQQINAINAELDAGGDDTVTLGRITALEAATRQGAPNLIVNSDYSDYDPNTGIIHGWTKSGSGWVVLPSDRGTFVQISGGFGATLRQNVPAYGGNGYSFGVEADPDDPQGSQTYLEWRGNSGQSLGTTPSLYADGWVRAVSTVFQAPPGTASAEIVLRQNASGGASVSRWSRVQVQLGEPTLWSDPATMRSNAARITAEEIVRAGQTGALATRASTLEAQVAGTAGSYLKSAIETVSTTASNQYGTVSQRIDTLTSSIGALNAPNLLDNGRFDNGFSGWTLSGGGSGWQVVTAYSEPFAQFTGSYGYAYKDYSGVIVGKPYCASFSGSPDGGNAELAYIEWWADGYAQYLGRVEVPWAGTERAAGGPFYPPNNTKIARVGIQTSGSGTGSRRWWKILFQQSATPTDYADTASLAGLQAQVTTQAGTLASIGGQVNTQGGQLGALSGTVAGQVTGLNNLTTKVSVRTLAYWASEATTGGTSAFITGRAEMSDGTVTSSVAIGAKEFWVYNDVNGQWIKTFGVVGGDVLIYGNLAVSGSVSAYNLKFGATGNVSKYYFQPYNDNAQTDWSAGPMGVGIVSQEGAPIEGRAIMTATNIGTAGGITYLKVIRTSDGVAVYGGDAGIPYRFPSDGTFMSVPIEFMDSVPAGQRAQYDVRVKQTGGALTRTIDRIETIREMVRDRFDELWIAAPAGQGPGAGSAGGGQINGDGSGDGGTGGTIGTRTPTGGGLAWKQIET